MSIKITPFDAAKYLETDEDIVAFLTDMLENGTSEDFINALGTVARARGMTEIARDAGVTRASLYKSMADGARPRFDTINRVVGALGLKLTIAT